MPESGLCGNGLPRPAHRPDSENTLHLDLPDFFGPFRHWKVASGFAAMPQDFLNAAGVCCPRLECGRTSLQCRRHVSITTFASFLLRNHCIARHSPRNLPLKLSFVPFCQGLPGSMSAVSSPFATAQRRIAFETNSGPLSERSTTDSPRSPISRARTSITRPERIEPATSMARLSLVYSSTTVRHFSCWPFAQASNTKS